MLASAVALLALGSPAFTPLNGDAWRGYKKDTLPAGWKFDGSHLVFTPGRGQGGDIVTKEQFGDFDFRLEWKVTPGGNSGIIYRVTEDKLRSYETGPEFQILDNIRGADGRSPLTSAGAIYGLYPATSDPSRASMLWNTARVLLHKGKLEHYINDVKVAEADFGSEEWVAKVKASKFRGMPDFGKRAKGHIVLQDHGNVVEYRNIRIARL